MGRNGSSNGRITQIKLAELGDPYVDAGDMARLAEQLIAEEAVTLAGLRNVNLAFEFRRGGKASDEVDIDKVSGAQVAPAAWKHRIGVDGRLWVFQWWWDRYPDHRGPVVLHQLLHLRLAEGQLRREPAHTVAEFDVVARRYGPWSDGLKLIYRQLELFSAEPAR